MRLSPLEVTAKQGANSAKMKIQFTESTYPDSSYSDFMNLLRITMLPTQSRQVMRAGVVSNFFAGFSISIVLCLKTEC